MADFSSCPVYNFGQTSSHIGSAEKKYALMSCTGQFRKLQCFCWHELWRNKQCIDGLNVTGQLSNFLCMPMCHSSVSQALAWSSRWSAMPTRHWMAALLQRTRIRLSSDSSCFKKASQMKDMTSALNQQSATRLAPFQRVLHSRTALRRVQNQCRCINYSSNSHSICSDGSPLHGLEAWTRTAGMRAVSSAKIAISGALAAALGLALQIGKLQVICIQV